MVQLANVYLQLRDVTSCRCVDVQRTVNAEAVEEKETYVQESKTNIVEKTKVETQKVVDCLEDTTPPLPLFVSPPSELEITYVCQQMTGSSITVVADEPYESVSTVSLKCTDQKPEVESVFAYRKLIVIRAADIPRSRSADIFRPDNVFTTSGPATARAQSETRDVEGSWNALWKTKRAFALKNLTSPVCAVMFSAFQHFILVSLGNMNGCIEW